MRQTPTSFPRQVRHAVAGALLTALVLWLTGGTPAFATGPGHYNAPTVSQDPTFTVLLTGNLLPPDTQQGNGGTLFYLSTTGTGLHKLPFPLFLYNQKYSSIAISSNGNVQPGVTSPGGFPNSEPPEFCTLPYTGTGRPLVATFWSPLVFDTARTALGYPQGVFVRTSGVAPHRTFIVSWQGEYVQADNGPVLAQAVFQEGVQTVLYLYGTGRTNAEGIIGIQSKQQLSWTTYQACGLTVTPGLRLTWTHTG